MMSGESEGKESVAPIVAVTFSRRRLLCWFRRRLKVTATRVWPILSVILWLSILTTSAAAQNSSNYDGLTIQGLSKFPLEKAQAALNDQWGIIQDKGLSDSRADDAAYLVNLALRREGFPESEVSWKIISAGRGLLLIVQEGPQLLLGDITLQGVKRLEESLLKEAMVKDVKERQSLLGVETDLPFVLSDLNRGVGAIEGYAIFQGFPAATASLESVSESKKDPLKRDITVRVVEGPRYLIRDWRIEGIEGRVQSKVEDVLEEYENQPYSQGVVRKVEGLVLEDLSERGFFDATVTSTDNLPDTHTQDKDITVVIQIVPGAKYKVAGVAITGNAEIPATFIEKRFRDLLDDFYEPSEVSEVFRELTQTGLFESIEITPKPIAPGRMQLDVAVEEAKFHDAGVYGGFGSFDGYIIGVRYADRNLFGSGRSFLSQVEMTGRGLQGEMSYLDRWFLDTKVQFGLRVFTGTRELLGYDKWEAGLRATFSYPFSQHTSLSLFAEFVHVSLTDNRFVEVDIGPEDYQVQTFGVAFSWDHSKDLETRGHGYLFETSLDYASTFLAGDVQFLRYHFRLNHYWQLFGGHELRTGIRFGAMYPLGDSEVIPVDLRFFNGGSKSVRSFPERELGPEDRRDHPTGGEFYTVFNVEYAVPITDAFYIAAFADAGNVLPAIEDISLDDMHYAAGLGLRYDLPVGPLRLDYGYNLNRQKGEPSGAFHIAFGFAF